MSDLSGRVALVTGGSCGIGQEIAKELQACGSAVVVADLVPPDDDGAGEYFHTDLTSAEAIDVLFENVISRHQRLDVLVNNAGLRRNAPSTELSLADWTAVLNVNLTAAFLCSAAIARHALDRGTPASIVNIASTAAQVGLPGRAAYCASKSGLLGLTRALAVEWAQSGIRVNAVGPGFVRTHMHDTLVGEGWLDEAAMLKRVPMNRLAHPSEVAKAVRFLASDEASYMTGQVIYVDGGWLAMGIDR